MNDNILIDKYEIESAQKACSFVDKDSVKYRALSNCLAAEIACKIFEDYNIDLKSGIHNVKEVLEDIDIADIYVNGNYIDVRLYTDEDSLYIPKSHFDYDILPAAYMFVKVNSQISGGTVTGFLLPDEIQDFVQEGDYYKVSEDSLVSFYNVESRLITIDSEVMTEGFEERIFNYLDNKETDKSEFYRILISSQESREFLINASKTKHILSEIKFENSEIDAAGTSMAETESLHGDTEGFVEELNPATADNLLELSDNIEPLSLESEEDTLLNFDSETNDDMGFIEELSENTESELLEEDNSAVEPLLSESADEIEMAEPLVSDVDENDSISDIETEQKDESLDISENETAKDAVIEELSEFDYSTEITPSISNYEELNIDEGFDNNVESDPNVVELSDEDFNMTEGDLYTNNNVEGTISESENSKEEEISELFEDQSEEPESQPVEEKKKTSKIIPLAGVIVLICALGYFGYSKFYPQQTVPAPLSDKEPAKVKQEQVKKDKEAPMPVETVENNSKPNQKDEGTAISIPAIEQNLGATISVANLSVNWEIPSGYANNNSAKRYLLRIGKVVQLNMKTELLLLSSQPMSNRVKVELVFNPNVNRFEIKGFILSSGDETIDNTIRTTLQSILESNVNSNASVFENLSGNPVLVINF